jgi:hypothetical protein
MQKFSIRKQAVRLLQLELDFWTISIVPVY